MKKYESGKKINEKANGGAKFQWNEFDERKVEDVSNINKITIYSDFVDVNVFASRSSSVEAHLHGKAATDGRILFELKVVKDELIIEGKILGNICCNRNLILDVMVPEKIFEDISFRVEDADIFLSEGISNINLDIVNKCGDVESKATFTNLLVNVNGNVKIYVDSFNDKNVDINVTGGTISIHSKGKLRLFNTKKYKINMQENDNENGVIIKS